MEETLAPSICHLRDHLFINDSYSLTAETKSGNTGDSDFRYAVASILFLNTTHDRRLDIVFQHIVKIPFHVHFVP